MAHTTVPGKTEKTSGGNCLSAITEPNTSKSVALDSGEVINSTKGSAFSQIELITEFYPDMRNFAKNFNENKLANDIYNLLKMDIDDEIPRSNIFFYALKSEKVDNEFTKIDKVTKRLLIESPMIDDSLKAILSQKLVTDVAKLDATNKFFIENIRKSLTEKFDKTKLPVKVSTVEGEFSNYKEDRTGFTFSKDKDRTSSTFTVTKDELLGAIDTYYKIMSAYMPDKAQALQKDNLYAQKILGECLGSSETSFDKKTAGSLTGMNSIINLDYNYPLFKDANGNNITLHTFDKTKKEHLLAVANLDKPIFVPAYVHATGRYVSNKGVVYSNNYEKDNTTQIYINLTELITNKTINDTNFNDMFSCKKEQGQYDVQNNLSFCVKSAGAYKNQCFSLIKDLVNVITKKDSNGNYSIENTLKENGVYGTRSNVANILKKTGDLNKITLAVNKMTLFDKIVDYDELSKTISVDKLKDAFGVKDESDLKPLLDTFNGNNLISKFKKDSSISPSEIESLKKEIGDLAPLAGTNPTIAKMVEEKQAKLDNALNAPAKCNIRASVDIPPELNKLYDNFRVSISVFKIPEEYFDIILNRGVEDAVKPYLDKDKGVYLQELTLDQPEIKGVK